MVKPDRAFHKARPAARPAAKCRKRVWSTDAPVQHARSYGSTASAAVARGQALFEAMAGKR